jgi:hypothetical protein
MLRSFSATLPPYAIQRHAGREPYIHFAALPHHEHRRLTAERDTGAAERIGKHGAYTLLRGGIFGPFALPGFFG